MVTASPRTTAGPQASSEPTGWGRGVAAIGYGLPFLLVVYLAFAGGGYDPVVYGEVGVICWWVVTLGALVGLLPLARISGAAWVALGLLAAFALWTGLGISWSESSERSVAELARVASFVGVFALAISVQGRALALRRTVYAVAAAIGVVTLFALFSRLHPELFPEIQAARFLDDVEARLSYPLDYWNALAALIAIGLPLVLSAAMSARNLVVQAIAAAALPDDGADCVLHPLARRRLRDRDRDRRLRPSLPAAPGRRADDGAGGDRGRDPDRVCVGQGRARGRPQRLDRDLAGQRGSRC